MFVPNIFFALLQVQFLPRWRFDFDFHPHAITQGKFITEVPILAW